MYQCQGKLYDKCWMVLHSNALQPPRGYLWLRIAASGPECSVQSGLNHQLYQCSVTMA